MPELDDQVDAQIKVFCREGDDLAAISKYREAIAKYNEAWALIPEPKDDWTTSTWVLVAIGDSAFLAGWFELARRALGDAMHCPDGFGNPFIHLRMGQCMYELNELDRSADNLLRAYVLGGKELFENDDPKYYAFLKTRARDLD